MIKTCASHSISFGAPAFNKGDRFACFRFYYNTSRSLVKLFHSFDPTLRCYKPDTLAGLQYLEEVMLLQAISFISSLTLTSLALSSSQALEMCKMDEKRYRHRQMSQEFKDEEESPSRHAWRMRFAFDRAQNLWQLLENKHSSLRAIASTDFPSILVFSALFSIVVVLVSCCVSTIVGGIASSYPLSLFLSLSSSFFLWWWSNCNPPPLFFWVSLFFRGVLPQVSIRRGSRGM